MSAARIVVSGATTALTRRTTLRKAFLGPWHPLVQDIWLYSLADAQRETGVAVHHTTLVPSHHHTSVTPGQDNLPEFSRRVHRDTSCALHVLLCRERYDAPRELFDDRPTHKMRLLDAAAQASHLVYEHLNTVAAGLVQRPEDMPGRTIDFALWKRGYIEVERPPVYFGSNRPQRLRLELTPPPLLYRAFGGDLDRLVYYIKRLVQDGLRAVRAVRRRPVLGARELQRRHPWSEPRTLRETGGSRVPTFRIGARGIVGVRQRVDAAREVHEFGRRYQEARRARRDGDHDRMFPYGTYAMRAYHGALVEAEPYEDAIVAMPGPLLCDVKAELAEARQERAQILAESAQLIDEVRRAVSEEAEEIVEHSDLDLHGPTSVRVFGAPAATCAGAGAADTVQRQPAVVRHRFDRRRPGDVADAPARLITLRDRRRGRPPGSSGRSGSDPPV